MKMILLAAVALATPAMAQQAPMQSGDQTMPAPGAQDTTMPMQSAPTDAQTMPQPSGDMNQAQSGGMAGGDMSAATPAGGYQPAQPPMSSQPMPGQQVIFQAAKSPSEAYPAPAPLKSYPICKKGQTDQCRQRGG